MFTTTLFATLITTLICACCLLFQIFQFKNSLTVQIEYYAKGIYSNQEKNLLYEVLAWIILQQIKELDKGSFIVQPTNSKKHESDEIPDFNILPEKKKQVNIQYRGRKFSIMFEQQDKDKNNNNNNPLYPRPHPYYKVPDQMPSIFLSITNDSYSNAKIDVNAISEFISKISSSYFKEKEKNHKCARYKCNEGYWHRVQYLSDLNSLESVVLDEPQKILLKKELDFFINNKEFYKRIGLPYRRGFLFYKKPGAGKTSLINAISSYLSRDIYHINLKDFKNDNEISAAFSSVPPNQIIVLEDVDTQSNVFYKRGGHPNYCSFISKDAIKEKDFDLSKFKNLLSFISLSNFLECLDGQMLSEGIIIIMTTNHIKHLDPAWLVFF
ncbi:P-loop containing nucleoside triphosphate hydrolase protein [Gigaspora margarita]|uniref:P-loop containing nucleoside triphosphate hydrolase protein n=1 Tax=Gigaspora margarita TaxID=4874 RepID=A0A8H3X6R7_GIGMA|nr:P-loop containing nucleoside triphosphate hydrolase protein [Gigaspora margarita]